MVVSSAIGAAAEPCASLVVLLMVACTSLGGRSVLFLRGGILKIVFLCPGVADMYLAHVRLGISREDGT